METNRIEGMIMKGIGGFYYVKPVGCGDRPGAGTVGGAAAAAEAPGVSVYECKARGIFRKERLTPSVGDRVKISLRPEEEGLGMIEEIEPRKNSFIRPPIANVDCLVTVIAAARPAPNLRILDQFLVMAEQKDAEVIICVNKSDLAEDHFLKSMEEIYAPLYPMVYTSGRTGRGVKELKRLMAGRACALSGPSGVGKSTLLNLLVSGITMETGAVSEKTRRGKHTTRHVELFETEDGGMIFDTPGFTSFDILDAEEAELQEYYPEMLPFLGACRYDNCRHLKEPDCAVRKALEAGDIHPSRYESYLAQMKEIRERKKY